MVGNMASGGCVAGDCRVRMARSVSTFRGLTLRTGFRTLSPNNTVDCMRMPGVRGGLSTMLSMVRFVCSGVVCTRLGAGDSCYRGYNFSNRVRVERSRRKGLI